MASLSFSSLPTSTTTNKPSPSLFSESSCYTTQSNRFKVSCNKAPADSSNENSEYINLNPKSSFERRNLLLGLGGLYGAAAIPSAFGIPIEAPDSVTSCYEAFSSVKNPNDAIRGLACCPPLYSLKAPVPYVFPKVKTTRVRPKAHNVSPKYIEQFRSVVQIMKALPDSDPHSWKNQAKIHCAYCNGGYRQEKSGFPDLEIQVHNSWLFLPFHRWYLYFLEKIMGRHLEDDTFALPYWNWDNPAGMMIPAMYEDRSPFPDPKGKDKGKTRSLFDPFRESSHLPPEIFDFNVSNEKFTPEEQIEINLALMYRQMISTGSTTRTFLGGEVGAGINPLAENVKLLSLGGSLENGVHTSAHRWVGNRRMPNGEDMGNFYSAGFDPVFYGHHANVDRMWNVWKELGVLLKKPGHKDPTHPDWKKASYVFYDENRVRVRVYNADCVDTVAMGYEYEKSGIPWISKRPVATPNVPNVALNAFTKSLVPRVDQPGFLPLTLEDNKDVSFLVGRPYFIKRSAEQKEKEVEMLYLRNIKYDCEKFVKFDVIVNDKEDPKKPITPSQAEFVGSFSQLPHNHGGAESMVMQTTEPFAITDLLEDTDAEEDLYILVKIRPKTGCTGLVISGIDIPLVLTKPLNDIEI